MSDVGQRERETQDRVVRLLRQMGYDYLGNWKERAGTSNIEVELLTRNLRARGYDDVLITKAVAQLKKAAAIGAGRDLYEANYAVYDLLRYGAKVARGVGESHETVNFIDWDDPQANHFAVAEEVTVVGQHVKRPDVVLYVNGIAVVTLELKRSVVAVSEGIRQTIGNQQPDFIRAVLHDRAARHGGQRRGGPALRGHRHAGEVLDGVEGSLPDREPAGQVAVPAVRQGPAAGDRPRLHGLRQGDTGRPAGTTSTSGSRPRRSAYGGVRAASSGIPRARVSRSSWFGWRSGCASIWVLGCC